MDGASLFDNSQGPYFDGCNTYALGSDTRCRPGYRNENRDGVCVKQSASANATRKSNASRSRKTGKTPSKKQATKKTPPKKPSPTRKRSQKMSPKKTSPKKTSPKKPSARDLRHSMYVQQAQCREERTRRLEQQSIEQLQRATEIRAEKWERGIMTPSPSDLSDDPDDSPKSPHTPTMVTLIDGTTLHLPSKIKTIGKIKKKIERMLGTPILKQSIYNRADESESPQPLANTTEVAQLGPLEMVVIPAVPPEFAFLDKTETKYSEARNNVTNMSRILMRTLVNFTHTPLTIIQLYELIKDDWMQYLPRLSAGHQRSRARAQSTVFELMYQMITDLKRKGYVIQSPSSFDTIPDNTLHEDLHDVIMELNNIFLHQITGVWPAIRGPIPSPERVAEALAITLVLNREQPYIATLFEGD